MTSSMKITPKMLENSKLLKIFMAALRCIELRGIIFTNTFNCAQQEHVLTLLFSFKLAPADNNNFTTSEFPLAEASINAVKPICDGKRTAHNPLIQCYCISHILCTLTHYYIHCRYTT